jgi:hypothetical protein
MHTLAIDPTIPVPGAQLRRIKTYFHTYPDTNVYMNLIDISEV